MKKFQKLIAAIAFVLAAPFANADEEFGLVEMQEAAKVGIATYLENSEKDASDVTGYAVAKADGGARLRVFFSDGSNTRLFCHFHDDHGHLLPSLEDIDCH